MKHQLGKKKIEEIEALINTNCWKAFFWIHSLLLLQLKYLLYYHNQVKDLGKIKVNIVLDEVGNGKSTVVVPESSEHKQKWGKLGEAIRYMSTAIDICHSRSLIDKEYSTLKKFNNFRNKKTGHPTIFEYLPEDKEVISMCKLGLKIVESLDEKIYSCFN